MKWAPKSDFVWHTVFEICQETERAVGRYIEGFYGPLWRHSALDFASPGQFEKMTAN